MTIGNLNKTNNKDESLLVSTSRSKIRILFLVVMAVAFIAIQNLSSIDTDRTNAALKGEEVVSSQEQAAVTTTTRSNLQEEEEQDSSSHLAALKSKQQQRIERRERQRMQTLGGGGGKPQSILNITTPNTKPPPKPLKVNYPIFVLNLPKTGTTTLWQYFECGLGADRAIHWWTTQHGKRIGPCVEHNIHNNLPPLQNCGHYDVWLDFGYATKTECFFPAVHGYPKLFEAYPNATFLLVPRQVDDWFHSAEGWGPMLKKWKTACRSAFFPHVPLDRQVNDDDVKEFYPRALNDIRTFARDHPSMNFIEPPEGITLSSPELGNWLQDTIGIDAQCWGKCQPHGTQAKCEGKK